MYQKAINFAVIISAMFLFAVGTASAQNGPCLLGVGNNCPQNTNQTNTNNGNTTSRGKMVYRSGQEAANIMAAKNYGQRYLMVLDRYWDHAQRCYVEERAWVSSVVADGGGQVAVSTGPSRSYCVLQNTWTAEQINQAEGYIAYSQKMIYHDLKKQEEIAPYLNDPKWRVQAHQHYQWYQNRIDSYKKYINDTQARVNQFAP